ncbi:MAG: cadherin domain-containing protein [Bacteroidota bacterium]
MHAFLALLLFACSKDDDGGTPSDPQNNAPEIEVQSFSASEAIADNSVIGTVLATDIDNDDLTFSIVTNSSNLFEITADGNLSLAANQSLDFETAESHSLSIRVSDGNASANATITITVVDVNENVAPVFNDQSFSIGESAMPGSQIGTLSATDADGDTLTYTWANPDDGNPAEFFPAGSSTGFTLDSNTGILSTVGDTAGALDFESRSSYPLPIIVSDGELSTQANITVNITDENDTPVIIPQNFTVAEDINDLVIIGIVVATDQDNDPLSLSIIADPDDLFEITPNGDLSLQAGKSLDFETATQHTITVDVSDGSGTFPDTTITINVTDVAEGITTVSTLAGSTQGNANGTGNNARFNTPRGILVLNNGDAFIVDSANKAIKRVTAAGVVTSVVSSNAFGTLRDIVMDDVGNLYLSDTGKHVIWKLTVDLSFPPNISYVRSVFAGLEDTSGAADGTGTDARFDQPRGLAIDTDDNIFVADRGNARIRKITPAGVVSTISTFNNANSQPEDVAVAADGTLYVSDFRFHFVGRISANTTTIISIVGNPAVSGNVDDSGTRARLNGPAGLALQNNTLYLASASNNTIRSIDLTTNTITTIAGPMDSSGNYVDGNASDARFRNPTGIAIDPSGNLLVADPGNHRIRKITFN